MLCEVVKKSGEKCTYKAKFGKFCGIHNKSKGNNNFGQNVKSRAGSTRNGFNNTYAKNNSILVTQEELEKRNRQLDINPDICMYCCDKPKEANDHLIPQCCTTNSIYGHNNNLNRVPSCSSCNSKKGGKVNLELKLWLKEYCNWSENKINKLFDWIEKNKEYLYLDKEKCDYLNEQHKYINICHEIFQKSCENKEDIMDNLIKYIAKDSTLKHKAKQLILEN